MTNTGSGYTTAPTVQFISSSGINATATANLGTGTNANKVVSITVTNGGTGYQTPPVITLVGGGGTGAMATAVIEVDVDKVESYGDNNKFKIKSADVLFSEQNPFGEIDKTRYTE
jgi:hypothetical protein